MEDVIGRRWLSDLHSFIYWFGWLQDVSVCSFSPKAPVVKISTIASEILLLRIAMWQGGGNDETKENFDFANKMYALVLLQGPLRLK